MNCKFVSDLKDKHKCKKIKLNNSKQNYLRELKKEADNGSVERMVELGKYYRDKEKNYDLMKKYFEMAIKMESVEAMYQYALFYHDHVHDFEQMKKYYEMAIDKGHITSMENLGLYRSEKGLASGPVLLEKAIKLGSTNAMCYLGWHYDKKKSTRNLAIKYFEMAIENGDNDGYKDIAESYYKNALYVKNYPFSQSSDESSFEEYLKKSKKYFIKYLEMKDVPVIDNRKLYIYSKTLVWPCKYEFMNEKEKEKKNNLFDELLCIAHSRNKILPKPLILLIAGYIWC
jgi:hypothetical protein